MSGVLYASGEGWVGSGVRSIETGIHDLFEDARLRIVASAYAISGGAFDLPLSWITRAASRGVKVILVVNRYSSQPREVMVPIEQIAQATGRVELWDYTGPESHDLHAKAIIADDRLGLIGSSNLSGNGLLRNYELAVLIEGEPARLAAKLIIELTRSIHSRRCL
jgi:phosphatidylserine/phosphatidylglycerophosphate/cardiolipin synthase-like enzyme